MKHILITSYIIGTVLTAGLGSASASGSVSSALNRQETNIACILIDGIPKCLDKCLKTGSILDKILCF